MTKTELMKLDEKDVYLTDKIGEMFVDEYASEDAGASQIGRMIMRTFRECKTKGEFVAANNILIATCGWSIESLLEKIKERDTEGYEWESFEPEEELD